MMLRSRAIPIRLPVTVMHDNFRKEKLSLAWSIGEKSGTEIFDFAPGERKNVNLPAIPLPETDTVLPIRLELLRDADTLLRTRPEFNYDRWLTQARSWGDNEEEKNLFEHDATTLVTIWGGDGDPLIFDYSWREWAGLIGGYYLPRWEKFYAMLQHCLDTDTPYREDGLKLTHGREAFRANDFYNGLGDWELQYTQTYGKARTPITEGDEVETASRLYRKYLQLAGEYYGEETGADKLVETYNFENLGEKR